MEEINEELLEKEIVINEISVHPFEYLGMYLIGIVMSLTVALAIVGVPLLIYAEVMRRSHKYYITNKRVIRLYALFSKISSSIYFGKIQDLEYTQNFIEKFLDIGKIHIKTSGAGLVEIVLRGVKDPNSVKKLIEKNMKK
ncbi:PH domain-containing protein [Candidatus Woesearchaeota archaeon]|nr:PH domain-containing protein [Candidatus Woesearchaeota archaeon]